MVPVTHRLLRFTFALALLAGMAAPLWADDAPPSLAEVRQIAAVRDGRSNGTPDQAATAAQGYLAKFPQGRYADEALLALAEGLPGQQKNADALKAYNRLIADYPDSAFRDQAMVQSLPLLNAAGNTQETAARMKQLTELEPNSIHRNQALLWKAQTAYANKQYPEAIGVLKSFQPGDDLSEAQQTAYARMLAMATWQSGKRAEARPLFDRYLKREDAPENKAEVLMLDAAAARDEQRYTQALSDYSQVVERYPAPAYLPEAQYQRAQLYAAQMVGDVSDDIGRARLKQAIAFYGDYLDGKDTKYRVPALSARAKLLAQAERPDDALRDLERLAAQPGAPTNDADTVKLRVALLRKLNRSDEASGVLVAAMKNSAFPAQTRADFAVEQAALLYDRKDCAQVETLLDPMPIFPDAEQRSRAFFMRGFCRYQRGDMQRASVDLEGLVNDPAYQKLVVPPLLDAYEKSGQTVRLTQLLEELIAAGRVEPSAENMERLAKGYEALGEPAKILDAYKRLAELQPNAAQTPIAHVRQGVAEESLGHNDAAQKHFEAAIAAPPKDEAETKAYLSALDHLQPIYRDAGRWEDLAALNTKAAALLKSPAAQAKTSGLQRDANLEWGRAELAKGNSAEAIKRLELARTQTSGNDPRRVDVVLALTAAYVKNKQSDKGMQVFRAELAKQPEGEQRSAFVAAGLAQHPEWSEALAKGGDREAAIKFYEKQLKGYAPTQVNERYATSLKLDALYRAGDNFTARAALFATLAADPAFAPQKAELNTYRGEIYREWGKADADRNRNTSAIKNYQQALALIDPADWRRRYQVTAAMGQVFVKEKSYSDLVIAYEDVLPDIKDDELQAQVFTYLGQVHLEWAREAEAAGNLKSARIRLWRALDYLPTTDAERRAGAAIRLSAVLEKDDQAPAAAEMLAGVLRTLPAGRPKQQVALTLGTLNLVALKNPSAAGEWLAQADTGDANPLSLEAGYRMSDIEVQANNPDAAAKRLEGLLTRKVDGSLWEVPIRYRLAVLYHQKNDLRKALAQYRAVAGEKHPDSQQRYAEAIAQAKQQASALAEYLKASGGEQGSKIAVPKVANP
ncbi:MAG TPA: tetratricopeptide repeat protein [bacterium]